MIDGDKPEPMTPWFKGFKGEIEKKGDKYTTTGIIEGPIIEKLPSKNETVTKTIIRYVITELPIGRGTQDYQSYGALSGGGRYYRLQRTSYRKKG